MAESDALEVINIWRHILVKGQKEQIDRFMDGVGRRFGGLGWSRNPAVETLFNRHPDQINPFYCWVSGPGAFPRVLLCLNRTTNRRVRGGTYDLLDRGPSLVDLAGEIQRVLAEVLEPAAAEAGLEVSYPRLGPISRVGSKTTAAQTTLADKADGRWPLPVELSPHWKEFVLTAVRDDVAINPEEFVAWLIDSGWSRGDAKQIAKQFYTEAARIGEHEESGRQPA